MPLIDVAQGTPEWHEARKGILTASNVASAAGLKGAYDSRTALWKSLNGLVVKEVTAPMMYGTEHEESARHDGEIAIGHLSWPVGIFVHPDFDWLGASPDGLLGKTALHEIKCRPENPYKEVPSHHMAQVQIQLACAGYSECFYQSWTPTEQRIWLIKIDQIYINWLFPFLTEFWGYVTTHEEPPRLSRKRSYIEPLPYELIYEGKTYGV